MADRGAAEEPGRRSAPDVVAAAPRKKGRSFVRRQTPLDPSAEADELLPPPPVAASPPVVAPVAAIADSSSRRRATSNTSGDPPVLIAAGLLPRGRSIANGSVELFEAAGDGDGDGDEEAQMRHEKELAEKRRRATTTVKPMPVGERVKTFFKLMDGCSTKNDRRRYLRRRQLPVDDTPDGVREEYMKSQIGEVACCDMTGLKCTRSAVDGSCLSTHRRREGGGDNLFQGNKNSASEPDEEEDKHSYYEAVEICKNQTKAGFPVLCKDQTMLDKCCESGCGGDDEWYWTAEHGRN